ncbi:hypothetical protein LJR074_002572 [Acidovorax sp. LjRoot74]|uniref:hypothetical protein n=1 Tax=Acidovorax sp. LjRoot74 TaxID=3342337 RepID=UPI003ECCC22E
MSQLVFASNNPAIPMIVSKAAIEKQATEAAGKGQSINDACPYPFGTAAADHFKAVYLLALPTARPTTPIECATT